MDASYIIYTGQSTPNIPITPGQDLQTILGHIDTAIATHNAAPDYTSYNLHCLRPTYTIATTQQFAESITDFLCTFNASYTTFSGTTYPAAISTLTTAINGLQNPALTYAPFSITSADGINTVWSKVFTGLTAMTTSIDPYTANWSTLSITPSHSVVTTWNNVITYLSGLATTIAGKQATIGTFDNSSNCLGGGSTDSITTTINLLRTYVCTLTGFNSGSITWGCVSSTSTLTGAINNIISKLSSVSNTYLSGVGTGLSSTSAGSCNGYTASIDTTWTGLYKAAVNSSDASGGTGDYLVNKFISSDSSLGIAVSGTHLDLTVLTSPNANKVKVNSSDSSADYLISKIQTTTSDWGVALTIAASGDNSHVVINPQIVNPSLFIQNMITTISSDSDLLTQFCALIKQCSSCNCDSPTGLTVTPTTI